MANITPELIKILRERTGVGVGKCKEALQHSNGDVEEAIAHLRKSGMASAVKKEGRTANEGKIGIAETDSTIAFVEVNAETDFVANNEKFGEFLSNIANEVANTKPASLESFLSQKYSKDSTMTIDEYRATIVQMIGENIQIGRITTLPKSSDKTIGIYSHMGGKIVSAVEISGSDKADDIAKEIAMHIAAAAPDYLTPDKVPANILEHEKEIAKGQIQNKPEHIIGKILEGKINAFFDAICLLRQKYIKDDKVTIEQLVSQKAKETGKPLSVSHFFRWAVGQK